MFNLFKKKKPTYVIYVGKECNHLKIGEQYYVEDMKKNYYVIKSLRGYCYFNKKDFKVVV